MMTAFPTGDSSISQLGEPTAASSPKRMNHHKPRDKLRLLEINFQRYSIVVWFGVSQLLHVHDTDVFERVSYIDVDIPIQAV
jgi:hypothetical protein